MAGRYPPYELDFQEPAPRRDENDYSSNTIHPTCNSPEMRRLSNAIGRAGHFVASPDGKELPLRAIPDSFAVHFLKGDS